jgi:polysaccharide export outer membrane protein
MAMGTSCTNYTYDNLERTQLDINAASEPSDFLLGVGDEISIEFFHNPELDDELTVRPDGKGNLKLVGDVKIAGLSVVQLQTTIEQMYDPILVQPDVSVNLRNTVSQVVFIGGEVQNPGMYELRAGLTPVQAIFIAGGLMSSAEQSSIVLFRDIGEPLLAYHIMNLEAQLGSELEHRKINLRAKDIIFVPPSRIASINKFMELHVHKIIPVMATLGISTTYERRQTGSN